MFLKKTVQVTSNYFSLHKYFKKRGLHSMEEKIEFPVYTKVATMLKSA